MLSLETVADRTAEALGRGLTPKSVLARVPPEGQGQSNLVSIMAVDHDARFAAQLAAAVSAKGSPADERDPAREIPSLRRRPGRHRTGTVMRTLVTGCAGFIGSHLVDSLIADGHEVVGIDCFNDNYHRGQKLANLRHVSDWDGFEFIPIDLARGDLRDIADECELIFHLAAEPGVRSSWGARYENYLRNNVLATQHVLEAVKHRSDVRVVYASSSSVYGNAVTRPTNEDTPLHPVSPYGQTKAAMEHLCELYLLSHGVDVVGLRYFTVYGPRQRPDMAFHRFSRALLEGEQIVVFGDGLQTRDFTYVKDVVAATRAAAGVSLCEYRTFNVGGGSPASLRDVLEILGQVAGRTVDVVYGKTERGDVRDTAADASRARAELGFKPQTALADGLASQFAWMREFVEADIGGDPR